MIFRVQLAGEVKQFIFVWRIFQSFILQSNNGIRLNQDIMIFGTYKFKHQMREAFIKLKIKHRLKNLDEFSKDLLRTILEQVQMQGLFIALRKIEVQMLLSIRFYTLSWEPKNFFRPWKVLKIQSSMSQRLPNFLCLLNNLLVLPSSLWLLMKNGQVIRLYKKWVLNKKITVKNKTRLNISQKMDIRGQFV